VRVLSRGREYSIKLALGARRFHLVRQLITEIGLVSLLGAALGCWLARAGIRLLVHLSASEVPRIRSSTLDSETVVVLAVTLIGMVGLVAIAPAALCGSRGGGASLGDAGRGSTESRRGPRLRQWLAVAQIAIALVLLIGAALMARSFLNLQQTDLGYDGRNVLAFNVAQPETAYSSHRSRRALYRELLGRLDAAPGVVAAAAMSNRPFLHGQVGDDWTFYVEGQAPGERQNNPRAIGMVVSTDYFRTMHIELLRGRVFTEEDDDRAERVIVISESLAQHAWPSQDPIGKRLCCGWAENGDEPWLTVVGVVENACYRDVYAPRLDIYEHYLQGWSQLPNFIVRTRSDPLKSVGAIREQIRAFDPRLSVEDITTIDTVIGRVFTPWRVSTVAFAVFAVVALGLASVGLFGVLAFSVHRRTREIGIRMAFGASNRRIASSVASQALGMLAVGTLLGATGSYLITRVLGSLLYGATAADATTYVAAAAIFLLAASLATFLPALQAMKVEPWVALRHE